MRRNSQPAREINVALPKELTPKQNASLINEFVREEIVRRYGMTAQLTVHDVKSGNPHAHIQMPTRRAGSDGFGKVERKWGDKSVVIKWREAWEERANAHLAKHGHDARIDHRSLAVQGITDRTPSVHDGPYVTALKREAVRLDAQIRQLESAEIAPKSQQVFQNMVKTSDSLRSTISRPCSGHKLR